MGNKKEPEGKVEAGEIKSMEQLDLDVSMDDDQLSLMADLGSEFGETSPDEDEPDEKEEEEIQEDEEDEESADDRSNEDDDGSEGSDESSGDDEESASDNDDEDEGGDDKESKDDETSERDFEAENELLRNQIIALATQGTSIVPDEEDPSGDQTKEGNEQEGNEKTKTLPAGPIKLGELEVKDYLTEDELDKVVDNPKLINTAINKAMTRMLEHLSGELGKVVTPLSERVNSLPGSVADAVSRQQLLSDKKQAFFSDNTDLTKASEFVDFTFKKLATEAISKKEKVTVSELYEKAGAEVRKTLSLPKQKSKARAKKDTVALPGANTKKMARKKQTPSGEETQQDLMNEMN